MKKNIPPNGTAGAPPNETIPLPDGEYLVICNIKSKSRNSDSNIVPSEFVVFSVTFGVARAYLVDTKMLSLHH